MNIRKLLMIVGLGVVLTGCAHVATNGGGQAQQQEGGSSEQKSAVLVEGRFVKGKKAPRVVVETFEGEELDISQCYGERAVVIDFWAGWCPFCVAEMPELQKIQDKYGDDLVMIGAHRTDTESVKVGKEFADGRGVTYPLVKDDGSMYRAAGGIGMPVAVFIDKNGVVTEIKSGPKTAEEIAEKVGAVAE